MRRESRRLSAIAGWPGAITPDGLAVAAAEREKLRRPAPGRPGGCGCGGRR